MLGWASERITTAMTELYSGRVGSPGDLGACVDGIVRIVLSHLTQPSVPPEVAVTQVRWLVHGLLGATAAP